MKTDFSIPRRQSLQGILIVFLADLYKSIRRNIYVFLPLLSKEIRENYLFIVLIAFGLIILTQIFYSYKSYLNFKFHVKGDRFFLRQGVFKFTDTEIPIDRIQNININQNIVQQVLKVVGFEIETAGQHTSEIQIKALTRDLAEELKALLLAKKQVKSQQEYIEKEQDTETQTKVKKSIHLNIAQLLKVGLSSNYFKGLGIVLLFISTIMQYIEETMYNYFESEFSKELWESTQSSYEFIFAFFVSLLLVTILVTVGRVFFKYFDLKVKQINADFEVEYGLIKKVNKVIKKNKVQVFEIEDNPIKKWFRIKNVYISQASSQEIKNKKKIGIVGLSSDHIQFLFKEFFEKVYPQQFIYAKSSHRLLFRLMFKYIVISGLIGFGLFLWQDWVYSLIIATIFLIGFTFMALKTVQKSRVGINEELIEIRSGSIHTVQKYIANYKIQSLSIRRSWFQQNNGHADLIIYTASGSERIAYLNYKEIQTIVNYLNFKVESSDLGWI